MTAKTLQTAPMGPDQTYSLDLHGGKVLQQDQIMI